MEKIILTTSEKLMRFDQLAEVLKNKIEKRSLPVSKPIELKKVVTKPTIVNIPPPDVIKIVDKQVTPSPATNRLTPDVIPTNVPSKISTQLPKESDAKFWWGVGVLALVIGGGLYLYSNGYFERNSTIKREDD